MIFKLEHTRCGLTDFRTKWNKIQLDATTQKRNDKKTYSLYLALDSTFSACILGSRLPEFNLTSNDGTLYSSTDLAGKVLYINFGRLGCSACWEEIPVLNKIDTLYDENKFVFISILLDKQDDFTNFFKQHRIISSLSFDIIANPAPFGYYIGSSKGERDAPKAMTKVK